MSDNTDPVQGKTIPFLCICVAYRLIEYRQFLERFCPFDPLGVGLVLNELLELFREFLPVLGRYVTTLPFARMTHHQACLVEGRSAEKLGR